MHGFKDTKWQPIRRIVQGSRPRVVYVVLHTIEGENLNGAENWFRNPQARGVGAHFGVGRFGEVRQWADTMALVYHATGANTYGIGIEQAGSASYSRLRWKGRVRQRRALCKLIARIHHGHGLGMPSRRTVKGHYDFPAGGHHDPGKGYPMDLVIEGARRYYRRWYL